MSKGPRKGSHSGNRECRHCHHGERVHGTDKCRKWPCECAGFEAADPWIRQNLGDVLEHRLPSKSKGAMAEK